MLCCFFFFKQKTAYELRISDWSSDVCSSDLFGEQNMDTEGLVGGVADDADFAAQLVGRQISGADHAEAAGGGDGGGKPAIGDLAHAGQIGRASCRERVCQYV